MTNCIYFAINWGISATQYYEVNGDWGLGTWDWGLGIGYLGLGNK
ncbi:hypothetical protein [uncultured Nostoc sp.]